MKQFSVNSRAVAFVLTAVVVTLFGLVSASWSNPALADQTSNPGVQATPTAERQPKSVGAPCDDTINLILPDILDNLIASAVVLPSPSHLAICTLKQVVPEVNAGFPVTFPEFQIVATGLFGAGSVEVPASPRGYSRITDAVQFAGAIGGNKVRMCFVLPVGYTAFKSVRIAYYDTTPGINRWVFLTTQVNTLTNQACMKKGLFKPIPAVFALFGQN